MIGRTLAGSRPGFPTSSRVTRRRFTSSCSVHLASIVTFAAGARVSACPTRRAARCPAPSSRSPRHPRPRRPGPDACHARRRCRVSSRRPRHRRARARPPLIAQRAATSRAAAPNRSRRCSQSRRSSAGCWARWSLAPTSGTATGTRVPRAPRRPDRRAARGAHLVRRAMCRRTTVTRAPGPISPACRCRVLCRCHGGLRVFQLDLVTSLTRQRARPCQPHATERCPERARRCRRCPLNGRSAAHYQARATILSRARRLLRPLRDQLLELDLVDVLVLLSVSLSLCLGAFLGWLLATLATR